jgi:hypothetical protein
MPAERQSGTAAAKVKGAKKVALDILRKGDFGSRTTSADEQSHTPGQPDNSV